MFSRKRTGFSAKAQRDFARSIKRARFMALMPYIQH
ncbi:MAG: 30S ribosomal protein S18 [Candidatus Paceibacterota bacterium]